MSRPISHRFISFLDRFESRLEVDCERLKHQLLAQVDLQFRVVRTKVRELRNRFGGGLADRDVVPLHLDDPKVETVSLEQCILERGAAAAAEETGYVRVTSAGRKRKSTVTQALSVNKRQKTTGSTAVGSNKFVCKFAGCGKAFPKDADLARHERVHLGVKPFSCTWPNCQFSSATRGDVIRHVREKHFKLARKKSGEPLITDDRDPNQHVQVDNELLERRIE